MRANALCRRSGLILGLVAAGCSDPESRGDGRGHLAVTVFTAGEDVDEDGYEVLLNRFSAETIPGAGTRVFANLTPGPHVVELRAVAPNCDVAPAASVEVTVSAGDTAKVTLTVTCAATGVEVSVSTIGAERDLAFAVMVSGTRVPLLADVPVRITRLPPGLHLAELEDVSPNCDLAGANPRPVEVALKTITPVTFLVTCVATTGAISITSQTVGEDLDLFGYTVQVSTGQLGLLPVNGSVLIDRVAGGDHQVGLAGVDPNCRVAGANPQHARLTVGLPTRDTVRLRFELSCDRRWSFAFTRHGGPVLDLMLLGAGDDVLRLAGNAVDPAWSPDGRRLAYECDGKICVHDLQSAVVTHLPKPPATTSIYDSDPVWRADG